MKEILSLLGSIGVFIWSVCVSETASVVWWSEFLATDPEVPGSITGPTRRSEK
jgi:hypothetical protein